MNGHLYRGVYYRHILLPALNDSSEMLRMIICHVETSWGKSVDRSDPLNLSLIPAISALHCPLPHTDQIAS